MPARQIAYCLIAALSAVALLAFAGPQASAQASVTTVAPTNAPQACSM